jgi:SAM-dependent methyltransferase
MSGATIPIFVALLLSGATLAASSAQEPVHPPMERKHHSEHGLSDGSDRGFHRSFGSAERWAKEFDDPARDAWQKPDQVLDALNLERNALVADLGAGTGYFSVRIAKRVPEGKVFAIDIEPDMVRYLRDRAQQERLGRLVPVLASAVASNLPEPVDLVLVVDTYHHIDNRVAYFTKLRASLRPNGLLGLVDFKADSPNGPPPEHRISPEKVTAEFDAAGYALVATHLFLPRQYFLVFQGKVL